MTEEDDATSPCCPPLEGFRIPENEVGALIVLYVIAIVDKCVLWRRLTIVMAAADWLPVWRARESPENCLPTLSYGSPHYPECMI